jgi:hypothetical protein
MHNRVVITKWTSKHNRMTITEGKFYLNLLDFISNGKCCRWTAAPTERPWIRPASVCRKYTLEYTGYPCKVFQTSGRYAILWRSNVYQYLSSYQDCNGTNKVTFHFPVRYQFFCLNFECGRLYSNFREQGDLSEIYNMYPNVM